VNSEAVSRAPASVEPSLHGDPLGGSLTRGFVWMLAGQAALLLGGIVCAALINRALAPSGRGVVAAMQTWATLLVAIFGLSLNTAIYHIANRDRYRFSDGARLALTLISSAGISVLAAVAMATLILYWPKTISYQAREQFWILLALPGATVFATNLTALCLAMGRVQLASISTIVQAGARLLIIGTAFLFGLVDLRLAILVMVIVSVLGALVALARLLPGVTLSLNGLSSRHIWSFLGAGAKQHVATISGLVQTSLNQIIVFHYCGDYQTGLLAAANTLAFGCFAAFGALQLALYPRVIHSSDDLEITIRSVRLALYGGPVLVIPLVLLAHPILRAYGGSQFDQAASGFRLLVPAAWLMSMSTLTAPYYVKAGAFGLASATAVLLGAISIALNVVLAQSFAATGAAAATLVTLLVGFLLALLMVRFISGKSPLPVLLPRFEREIAVLRNQLARHV
jgi:O-antigen/teichoic acid export membrane protein